MVRKKKSLIQSFLLISLVVWFGCGEAGDGTLEFTFNTPKDNPFPKARVRVDTKYKWTLDMSEKLHSRDIEAGRYIIGVDFLNPSGDVVHTYLKIVEINEGEKTPIEISIVTELGALELKINKPQSSAITKARILVNRQGKETFELTEPTQTKRLKLKAGKYEVSIEYLDRDNNVVLSSPAKTIEIQVEQTEQILEGIGTLELNVNKSQRSAITQAHTRVDGQNLGRLDSTTPIQIELFAGKHTFTADFIDGKGNLILTIPPKTIGIQAGQTEQIQVEIGTLELNVERSQGSAITQAQVQVDGQDLGRFDIGEPIRIELFAGKHTFRTDFIDGRGNLILALPRNTIEIQAGQAEPVQVGIGTLELNISKSQDSLVTQADVQVDGTGRGRFALAQPIRFELFAGEHTFTVDFVAGDGTLVLAEPQKRVEISAGQIERIPIKIDIQPVPTGCVKATDVNYQITQPSQYILLPDGKSLKSTEGVGIAVLGLMELFDCETGKRTGAIIASSEFIGDTSIWEFDEKEGKFKGGGSGRFIIYRGRKEEGEVIFEGNFIADPPGNMRALVNPEDGTLIEFKVLYRLEAEGKGIYRNHFLTGTAVSELKGDNFVVSMEAEIKRRAP